MQLLLISSSIVHGHGFLDHPEPEIRRILGDRGRVGFVPFAGHDHAGYVDKVRTRLGLMGFEVSPVESADDLETIEALFIGGGNTFRLLAKLYERNLLDPIRAHVRSGLPYLGSSAGSNIAGPTIRTTNDMPIVQPPNFDALGLVPFQINPHYLDADPDSTHHGETREQRIFEYHEENETPVVAIREGSALRVDDGLITLTGDRPARIFRKGQDPVEVAPGGTIRV